MKKIIIWIVVIALVGVGIYFLVGGPSQNTFVNQYQNKATTTAQTGTPTGTVEKAASDKTVIGKSVDGRDIVAYHYGTGSTELLFIGGIHGGYEWNTALVAYQMMDYLKAHPGAVASNLKVTVIPVLNPDGLNKVVGTTTGNFSAADVSANTVAGRFNANNVDLNRNFDCDWQATGKWQNRDVSGGSSVFSEPESQAIKNYVTENKPTAVVVWYSSAGGVYASSCHNGVSTDTNTLTKTYSDASGYPAFQTFDFYSITGDMVNWFAKNNIPAISVLLTNHTDTEMAKNQAGLLAVLKYYSK